MNHGYFVIAAAVMLCAAELPAQPTTRRSPREPSSAQRGYSDRYGLLEQRNIFLRDRSKPTTRRSTPGASTQPARRPEQMLVVTGIVFEDDSFRAYIEDTSVSPPRILRVSPGDHLGPGRVTNIQIDAIAYEQAGESAWINVGSDLSGQAVAATSLTAGTATAPSDSAANLDPNDPNLTVEQRMRLRSQQQRQGR